MRPGPRISIRCPRCGLRGTQNAVAYEEGERAKCPQDGTPCLGPDDYETFEARSAYHAARRSTEGTEPGN